MSVRGKKTFAEEVGALKRTLHRTMVKQLSQDATRPFQQMSVLRLVAQGEVETQAELVDRMSIDPPAVSRLVAKLEAEGLLRRSECADRRCVKLEITARAKPEVETFLASLAWLEREVRKHVTPAELEATVRTLRKVKEGLSKK